MADTLQPLMTHPEPDASVIENQATTEPDAGVRFYQGRFLDELPGAAFALVTLVWAIGCFFRLIW